MQRARPRIPVVLSVLLSVALVTPSSSAGVLVVDGAGSGDFTTLSDAVAAAANGDTILVYGGEYVEAEPIVIDGKSLTVVGYGTQIKPGLVIQNLQAGQRVLLQHLFIQGSSGTSMSDPRSALLLRSNGTHVRVEGCEFVGGDGTTDLHPAGAPAVTVTDSLSNALIDCVLRGGEGQYSSDLVGGICGDGGAGLAFDGGLVLVSACDVDGGNGGGGGISAYPQGGTGGDGIEHQAGTLFVVGGISHGGDGGLAHWGGDGGDGIDLGPDGHAWLMGAAIYWNGSGSAGDATNGDDGLPLNDAFGLATDWSDTVHGLVEHGFDITSPVREGLSGTLYLQGHFSDSTLLFISPLPYLFPLPKYQGVLGFSMSAIVGPIVFPAPGFKEVTFMVPMLPAGLDALPVFIQPAYVGADGVFLGTSRLILILDSSV